MKTIFAFALLISISTQAQIVSKFTFSTTPLTTATVGPNGTSVNSTATSDYIGGSLGYAINPGLPVKNIDLIVPGSPTFDINDIDIDLYFRKEESVASFFKRGSLFNFEMNGGFLRITFTTTQGSTPGNITINSGNIYNIPDDHQFHHYRFSYDNTTGLGKAYVDGTVVYTYTGYAGRPLAWTSAGNVIIGENMDATGRNIAVLSNLTVQHVAASVLPVTLIKFTGAAKNGKTLLQWSTTNETGFSHFEVERSTDGIAFNLLKSVPASSAVRSTKEYQLYDEVPVSGMNYYRLKMVDADGSFKYSDVIKVSFESLSKNASTCFPNPATSYVNLSVNSNVGNFIYTVSNLQGNILKAASVNNTSSTSQIKIDLSAVPAGMLVIRLQNAQTKAVEIFKVMKTNG